MNGLACMWQTKYAAAIPKNLGVGVNFRPCSEGYFLSGRPESVLCTIALIECKLLSSILKMEVCRLNLLKTREDLCF